MRAKSEVSNAAIIAFLVGWFVWVGLLWVGGVKLLKWHSPGYILLAAVLTCAYPLVAAVPALAQKGARK